MIGSLTRVPVNYIGTKQGDSISPTMYSIFVNDLVAEINNLDLEIKVGDRNISMLLYADDINFMANSENDLQSMINTLSTGSGTFSSAHRNRNVCISAQRNTEEQSTNL